MYNAWIKLGTNVGRIDYMSGGLGKHLNLFSHRHRRLILELDSQYLRKAGEGQIASHFVF